MSRMSASRWACLKRSSDRPGERGDEVIGELLDGRVPDPGAAAELRGVVADGVEQVGLAESRRRVEEQGVVRLAGQFGHRQRGRVGQAVAVADDELLEAVARVEGVLDDHWGRLGSPARRLGSPGRGGRGEQDPGAGADHGASAGLDHRAKALDHPRLGGRRRPDRELSCLPAPQLERLDPELVLRVADRPPELGAYLSPGGVRLGLRRELHALLPERRRGPIEEERTRTSVRGGEYNSGVWRVRRVTPNVGAKREEKLDRRHPAGSGPRRGDRGRLPSTLEQRAGSGSLLILGRPGHGHREP